MTREELYDVVWTQPLYKAAPGLSVSVPALVETCARARVPLPGRGYWGKVQFGKAVRRTALPMRAAGVDPLIYVAPRRRETHSSETETFFSTMPSPVFSDDLVELEAAITASVPRLRAPALSSRIHPEIADLIAEDERRRSGPERGYARRDPWFDGAGDRRLRILNAVFLGLERMDAAPSAGPDYLGGLRLDAIVGNTRVSFDVASGTGKKRRGGTSQPLELRVTTDELAETRRSWRDEEGLPLERQISAIVAGAILAGELVLRARNHELYAHALEWRQRRDEERRRRQLEAERQEREREAAAARARIERLLSEAERFRQAAAIREYVASARLTAAARPGGGSAAAIESWAASALSVADAIDPVRSGEFLRSEEQDS